MNHGLTIEQKDEPCAGWHQTREPLEQIPDEKRWRIVEAPNGHRSLVAMTAIRNEPSCSSGSCHEHHPSQKVLGVVDAYSLDEADQLRGISHVHLADGLHRSGCGGRTLGDVEPPAVVPAAVR